MIDAWLDLLHGGSCAGCGAPGRSLCRACWAALPRTAGEVSPDPRPEGLAPCVAAAPYDGLVRDLLLAHKEQAAYALREPLAHCLATALRLLLRPEVPLALVPVPSTPAVVRARGHDPLLRVVRRSARLVRAPGQEVATLPLLAQRGAVADQAGLDSGERRRNREGSMVVRPGPRERLARSARPVGVVVVDDVLTTGATAREAQRALEDAGVAVSCIAVVAATRRRWSGVDRPTTVSTWRT